MYQSSHPYGQMMIIMRSVWPVLDMEVMTPETPMGSHMCECDGSIHITQQMSLTYGLPWTCCHQSHTDSLAMKSPLNLPRNPPKAQVQPPPPHSN